MESEDKDRLTTLGELSAILAHEMKNPMNSIIINIETLRSTILELAKNDPEGAATARAKKYTEVIEGEVRRLDKVLRGFLDFANPSSSTKVRFKVNSVIQSLVDFLSLECKKSKVSVNLDLSDDAPAIVGSSDQIRQALMNLMLNALHALPEGGSIRLKTENSNGSLRILVEDTGVGIDPSTISKIFDPYFTTKEKGSGLGLTVVRRIIKDHGGDIQVQSQPSRGTKFEMTIPSSPIGVSG